MKRKLSFLSLIPLLAVLVSASRMAASGGHQLNRSAELASPLGTTFTYQGRLEDTNGPVNDNCDFEFRLFGSPRGSDQIGDTLLREGVLVADGYFTVADLDFGATVFQGEARWLEIAVRCPSGSWTFESLSPRQALTASPYALYALSAGSLPWSGLIGVPAGFADGVDDGSTYTAGDGLTLIGTQFSVNTSLIQARVGEVCPNGSAIRTINQDGTVSCETDSDTTTFWGLSGSSGTNPASNYLGTSDNQPLVLRVNDTQALRLEPTDGTPNLVGGYSGNSVTAGVHGAVIAGGGESGFTNRVTDHYGTVGGGINNQAGDNDGEPFYTYTTVGGGYNNTASGPVTTIGGGWMNTASGECATVGGGYDNTASGLYAIVPGGFSNEASGGYSFAAGYRAIANDSGAFVWADQNLSYFDSRGANTVRMRATGGFDLVAAVNLGTGESTWACGFSNGTSWSCSSDREQKENFQVVDSRAVLEKVSQLPVQYWNAKGTNPTVKHLGPTAQDFSAAFELGNDDNRIATIDLDGVALAAIQGLYELSQQQEARIAALEGRLEGQQGQIEVLEARLAALEDAAQPSQAGGPQRLGYLPYFGFAALGFGIVLWARKRGGAG